MDAGNRPAFSGWSKIVARYSPSSCWLVTAAKTAIAEPFYVPSGSMEPTLLIGDELLATKFPYGYGTASLPAFIVLPSSRAHPRRLAAARRRRRVPLAGRPLARSGSSASSACPATASR